MTPTAGRSQAWIGLGEASRLLGVAPGTLRRWADTGRVPVFLTPGGHRRFSRRTLARLLPATRVARPTLARLGASPERIARAYHGGRRLAVADRIWVAGLADETRDAFRARGHDLVALLLSHLDAPDAGDRADALQAAAQLAAEYGRELADLGIPLETAVNRFVQFRGPFLEELAAVARRRGLDTREAVEMLAAAGAATDRLLESLMAGHALARGARENGR